MTRLKDLLEPGERVLLRLPLLPAWQPILMIAVGFLTAASAGMRFKAAAGEAASSLDLIVGIVMVAVSLLTLSVGLLQYFLRLIWIVLLTDRRILQRQGREHEEIRLADIDEVRPYRLGDGLFVIAGDRKIILPCKERPATRIREAIDAAKGAAP